MTDYNDDINEKSAIFYNNMIATIEKLSEACEFFLSYDFEKIDKKEIDHLNSKVYESEKTLSNIQSILYGVYETFTDTIESTENLNKLKEKQGWFDEEFDKFLNVIEMLYKHQKTTMKLKLKILQKKYQLKIEELNND